MTQDAMTKEELMDLLVKEAKIFREKALESIKKILSINDVNMIKRLKLTEFMQRVVDVLLVSFINNVAAGQGLDYGLKISHLKEKE